MECLESHKDVVVKENARVQEELEKPASSMDTQELISLMEAVKERMKSVELDVRDGKRRLSAAKGPKAKKAKKDARDDDIDSESLGL